MMLRPRPVPGRLLWLGLALSSVLPLGGCAALDALQVITREPPRLYNITPKSTFAADLPEADARLSVEVPTATAGLNTSRITLRPTPTMLDYYAAAQWIDVMPVMVQNLLIESFDNSDRIDVLGRETVGVRADYALITHVREFQAEYPNGPENPPEVRVRLQVRLVELPRRTHVASNSFESVVRARTGATDTVVLAFDQAFGRVAREVVEWTIREIAAHTGGGTAS
ncbi:MAG TPA: ABC-type transport auxiliary lipoprotein family protein [Geminicoccaceae bacterium]|nr:ABC-type transport auxiliary lipoprotein family protein [Geminicoccaceae bacterium]